MSSIERQRTVRCRSRLWLSLPLTSTVVVTVTVPRVVFAITAVVVITTESITLSSTIEELRLWSLPVVAGSA